MLYTVKFAFSNQSLADIGKLRMAKKVRFYKANSRTVRENTEHFVPAPTKLSVKNALSSENVVVDNVEYLGWADVKVQPDQQNYTQAEFEVSLEDNSNVIREGDLGYKHLRMNFQPQVEKLERQLDPRPDGYDAIQAEARKNS